MYKSLSLALGLMLAGTQAFAAEAATAKAKMMSLDGTVVGDITITETPSGIIVQADLTNLTANGHGFHIHETGSCAEDFKAAGGHYNPHGQGHGHTHTGGAHVGDLPNIYGTSDGTTRVDIVVPELKFDEGEAQLFDADGSAFIIHALPDTYGKEAGAGGRIACGVIALDS
jgi:Cu-Zn family superoxide dismutase